MIKVFKVMDQLVSLLKMLLLVKILVAALIKNIYKHVLQMLSLGL